MQLEIISQSHNRVDWVVRTNLLWLELASVCFVTLTSLLLLSTDSPIRWWVTGLLIGVSVLVTAVLAATTPHSEIGVLEREPDGGVLTLHKVWIPIGKKQALMVPVEDIVEFRSETAQFQDSDEDRYLLSRLWVIGKDGSHQHLTHWLDPDSVSTLGDVLSKAARCEYERGEVLPAVQ
ncbi:MAG: hypothetical protein P1S60_02090 [Anaerolineae bacterium]|nr:hypothetical protein [Anaerolineae bacterium]